MRLSRWLRISSIIAAFTLLSVAQTVFAQNNMYTVQPGDNLFRIATIYGVSVNDLAQANNIANTWQIYAGQTLVIPGPEAAEVPVEVAEAAAVSTDGTVAYNSGTPLLHTVQRGDNLASIARAYNLTPDQLAQMNNITNPNLIYAGQQLQVGVQMAAAPVDVSAQAAPPAETGQLLAAPVVEEFTSQLSPALDTRHTVQPGEYLSQIAARYGVSWTAIAQANNIYDADTVFAGQTLIIPDVSSALAADGLPYQSYSLDYVPAAPAAPTGIGREILVDLSDQRVYAYENGMLMRNVLVSTGLPATPTVQGSFVVERKYIAQTMSGPGYYLPDVPYVLYFYSGYAFHGTYWHENWGQPMSHGCVNMPTWEAEWLYSFADFGTPVTVQA